MSFIESILRPTSLRTFVIVRLRMDVDSAVLEGACGKLSRVGIPHHQHLVLMEHGEMTTITTSSHVNYRDLEILVSRIGCLLVREMNARTMTPV